MRVAVASRNLQQRSIEHCRVPSVPYPSNYSSACDEIDIPFQPERLQNAAYMMRTLSTDEKKVYNFQALHRKPDSRKVLMTSLPPS